MARAGPSTSRSTELDTTPHRELAGLRGARTVLVDVLERALGRRTSAGGEDARSEEPGEGGGASRSESESELEYVEPETWRREREEEAAGAPGATAGQRRDTPGASSWLGEGVRAAELRALQREKWLLAFDHIRECEAAQRRDRRELVAALVEARSSAQRRGRPRRSRYRTPA
ncbi:hypothetical protein PHLGIDRAFT_119173 [Phlebiopsis gigantea 11061_1 CR5-6]|uniref:Uncharacterized protein n=1 Tax=Phlebiopsis gigantea (strain 11061_1 CR5-6) TaxID=745531 RepID=A0A0C3S6I1_PHLG1|nr:hypothetical protein PHLGIDRAFT_119173 [Phlebiopsis gigantea 11061_1 CR5-6]